MKRILFIATSRETRGGITAVLKLYEQSRMWQQFHCTWIGTHRDGSNIRKIAYLAKAMIQYLVLLPFYDIVHIHFSLTTSARRKYPFFKLAKALGKKTVIHLHCGSQIDEIWNPVYQDMFERCDAGILLSESLKAKVEDHIGPSQKLFVVYNPCPPIAGTDCFDKRNQILFSGTLYEGKGYKDLIRAFAGIAANHSDWQLVFAGNGEEDQARAISRELGVENQVKLLGWVSGEAKHRAFSESQLLCLPSYAEGFPMAVLDAWAYGLPVITTPVGGIPDVAVDGDNMLLFEPGDIETLTKELEMTMTDEILRHHLAKASQELASTTFDLETVTGQLVAIYNGLVS